MSEDEARAAQAAAAEYMKHVPIGEVVISTVQTLIELGYRRTGLVQGAADERDLAQTELAIEALRALMPGARAAARRRRRSRRYAGRSPSSSSPMRARPRGRRRMRRAAGRRRPSPTLADGRSSRGRKIWTPGGEV